jgi:DNA replication protein DnaC
MSLTTADYNEILSEYNARRLENHRLLSKKREDVYARIPNYRSLEEEIVSLSAEKVRASIRRDTDEVSRLSDLIEDKIREQKLALTGAGFSINYLEPIYLCPICKDTGFVDGSKCSCFKQALMDRLYEQSNIKEKLSTENFSTLRHDFQVGEDAARFEKAYAKAKTYAEEFGDKGRNLCFTGTVGTGKTFLSNCIVEEVIKKGCSCLYFSAPTLFSTIADYKFRKSPAEVNTMELLYTCDLLVVDDLGTEVTNSFVLSELLALLNERSLADKSTIISTNLSLEEICNRYSDRVFSRLFSNFEICTLSGQDIRLYIKQMQNRK